MPSGSPQAISPPISSWDMASSKSAPAMSNSYIPHQYAWYHHSHEPGMNPQLLT